VTEDGLAVEPAGALEQRHDADAVEHLPRLRRQARHLQERGVPVDARDDPGAPCPRLHDAGPRDDARFAHASLVDGALASSQRRVVGGRAALDHVVHVAAVVGEEDDNGIVGDAKVVECIEQSSEALVQAPDHSRHDGTALLAARVRLVAVLSDQRFFRLERRVDGPVPEAHEEGFAPMLLDIAQRLVRDAVGEVLALRSVGHGSRTLRPGAAVLAISGVSRGGR